MRLKPIEERIAERHEYTSRCIAVEWTVEDLLGELPGYLGLIDKINSDDDSIFVYFKSKSFEEIEAELIPILSDLGPFCHGKWSREVSETCIKWNTSLMYSSATVYIQIIVHTSEACSVTLIETGRTERKMCYKTVPVYDYQISCPEEADI